MYPFLLSVVEKVEHAVMGRSDCVQLDESDTES